MCEGHQALLVVVICTWGVSALRALTTSPWQHSNKGVLSHVLLCVYRAVGPLVLLCVSWMLMGASAEEQALLYPWFLCGQLRAVCVGPATSFLWGVGVCREPW